METSLDKLRAAGAVCIDVDLGALAKAALAVAQVLRPEGFHVDFAEFLARENPDMSMNDAIAGIASKDVRAQYEDARDHPPSRENVEKAQEAMEEVGAQYRDAFRRYNVVAIAYPPTPFPAPLLPTDGDALPSPFEINGRQYPGTAITRNSFTGPAFRRPLLRKAAVAADMVRLPPVTHLRHRLCIATRLLALSWWRDDSPDCECPRLSNLPI